MIDEHVAGSLGHLLTMSAGQEGPLWAEKIRLFMGRQSLDGVELTFETDSQEGGPTGVGRETVRDLASLMSFLAGSDGEFWVKKLDQLLEGDNPWPDCNCVSTQIDPPLSCQEMLIWLAQRGIRIHESSKKFMEQCWPDNIPSGPLVLSLPKVGGRELGLFGRYSLHDFLAAVEGHETYALCEQWWGPVIRWSYRSHPRGEVLRVGMKPLIFDGRVCVWRFDHGRPRCMLSVCHTANRHTKIFGPDDLWLLVERDQCFVEPERVSDEALVGQGI